MNKIIFLDIDGVCNSRNWYRSEEYFNNDYMDPDLDPKVLYRLNKLCDNTGAKIVISSSWKVDKSCKDRLEHAGLRNIIDSTPDLIFTVSSDLYCRGLEINTWLYSNIIDKYIILDDEYDFYEDQRDHLILIDWITGLTDNDCLICENMLK